MHEEVTMFVSLIYGYESYFVVLLRSFALSLMWNAVNTSFLLTTKTIQYHINVCNSPNVLQENNLLLSHIASPSHKIWHIWLLFEIATNICIRMPEGKNCVIMTFIEKAHGSSLGKGFIFVRLSLGTLLFDFHFSFALHITFSVTLWWDLHYCINTKA